MKIPSTSIINISEKNKFILFVLGVVIICLFFPSYILFLILKYWSNILFWDEWYESIPIIHYYFAHHIPLNFIFAPHNEHRVIWGRLLYLLDTLFFHNNELFFLLLQLIIQSTLLMFIAYQFSNVISMKYKAYWAMLIIFSALLFSVSMATIWFDGFLVVQTLSALTFCMTVFIVNLDHQTPKNFFLTIFIALVTTGTTFNGLLIWTTITILLIAAKASKKYVIFWTVIGVAVISIYLHHLGIHPLHAPVTIRNRIHYIFAFIGSIFSMGKLPIATYVGLLASMLYATFILLIYTKKFTVLERHQLLRWLGLGGLSFGSAILGSIGRIDEGIPQALSERYLPLSVLLWIGLMVCSYAIYKKMILNRFNWLKVVILFIASFLTVGYFRTNSNYLNATVEAYQQPISLAVLALEQNVYTVNPAAFRGYLHPNPQLVLADSQFLKQHLLSLFHNNKELLNLNIKNLGLIISQNSLSGSFQINKMDVPTLNTCAYGFTPGFSVSGEITKEFLKHHAIDEIYILDTTQSIRGIGKPDFIQPNKHNVFWSGFIILPTIEVKTDPLQAYVKLAHDNHLYSIPQIQLMNVNTNLHFPSCRVKE